MGLFSGLCGTLLGPYIQHRFWKGQRGAELRYATLEKTNQLAGEFLAIYSTQAKQGGKGYPREDTEPSLSDEFLTSWFAQRAKVNTLFSLDATLRAFRRLDKLIMNDVDPRTPFADFVREFDEAHCDTLKSMYLEVGVTSAASNAGAGNQD